MVFDYLDGAAGDESGLDINRQALQRILFAPRRLVDVATRETGITLFGRPYKTPLIIAPIGLNGVFWPDGDIALARAAARAGIPFCLSTAANNSIEAVARCAFRRLQPSIPIETSHLFRSKPAGHSDDPSRVAACVASG